MKLRHRCLFHAGYEDYVPTRERLRLVASDLGTGSQVVQEPPWGPSDRPCYTLTTVPLVHGHDDLPSCVQSHLAFELSERCPRGKFRMRVSHPRSSWRAILPPTL